MALPGGTAEASLYRTSQGYGSRWAGRSFEPGTILPSDLSKCGSCDCPGRCCEREIFGCSCTSCAADETDSAGTAKFLTR
jgi:hypothetical protein